MENYSYHVPFYVVDGTASVATSGHCADLTALQVGIFDRANFNVATGGGSGTEFFFAQGVNGGKDWYGNTLSAVSHKSPFFRGVDVEDLYVSLPHALQNEEWIIGYNGAVSSVGLKFEKGKALRIKFYFHGQPTYRFYNAPKEYVVSYTPLVDCTEPCEGTDCADATVSDPIVDAKKLVDLINNHVELQKFGVKAYLTFAAATDEGNTVVTAQRVMKITLNRKSDGSDRIADIQTDLAGIYGMVGSPVTVTKTAGAGTGTAGQADDYTVTQTSYDLPATDFALSNQVTFQYQALPAIENVAWTFVSETDPADVAAGTPVADRKVGIRVTAGFIDPRFGNCSFNPLDYYETEPVKMEVSLLQEDGDRCDAADWPSVLQTKFGQQSRQTGEYIIREVVMKDDAYLKHIRQFDLEPRMREAFDQRLLDTVDRTALYKLYYISFKASYGYSYRKGEQEKFTAVFAVKSTDTTADTAFNTNIIGVVQTKSGKTMTTEA